MTLYSSAFELLRRYFFKHQVYDVEKARIPVQGQDGNTKPEHNTSTKEESNSSNDITQLQSYANKKLSLTSIMCRIGLMECEDCGYHRASKDKPDIYQEQPTNGYEGIVVHPGQRIVIEIVVRVPYPHPSPAYQNTHRPYYPLRLAGLSLPMASAMGLI